MKPRTEEITHLISISRLLRRGGVEVSVQGFRGAVRETTDEDFESRLAEAGERSPYLIVNLSGLDHIDESGLGRLLHQARVQERAGGWLRVVEPSAAVARFMESSEVSAELHTARDVDDALRDLPIRAA